mgnify:FL=1
MLKIDLDHAPFKLYKLTGMCFDIIIYGLATFIAIRLIFSSQHSFIKLNFNEVLIS